MSKYSNGNLLIPFCDFRSTIYRHSFKVVPSGRKLGPHNIFFRASLELSGTPKVINVTHKYVYEQLSLDYFLKYFKQRFRSKSYTLQNRRLLLFTLHTLRSTWRSKLSAILAEAHAFQVCLKNNSCCRYLYLTAALHTGKIPT